jgi:hypothetical protein
MIKKTRYQRVCPCCDERFVTTNSIKYYLNSAHQKKANDITQNEKRKKFQKINKPMNDTYEIYKTLLGDKNEVRKSKEFLRGRGANLKYFNRGIKIENKMVNVLFDIAIIEEGEFFYLKKIRL